MHLPLSQPRPALRRGRAGFARGTEFARRAAPLAVLLLLAGQTLIASPAGEQMAADLLPIKEYTLANAVAMQDGTEALRAVAADYRELLSGHGFNYDAAWQAQADELRLLVGAGRDAWVQASTAYELSEGIVAGVPSLAYYDVWIDAGPSAAEDPAEALDWTLTITEDRVLTSPGNLFHHLTEPVLWGTKAEWNAAQVDLDRDGAVGGVGDALPEAAMFLAVAGAIDDAAAEMEQAVAGWQPNLNDVFTALVVMVPTMNEYFGQWKESRYVAGDASREGQLHRGEPPVRHQRHPHRVGRGLPARDRAGGRARSFPRRPHPRRLRAVDRVRGRPLRAGARRAPSTRPRRLTCSAPRRRSWPPRWPRCWRRPRNCSKSRWIWRSYPERRAHRARPQAAPGACYHRARGSTAAACPRRRPDRVLSSRAWTNAWR